MKAQADICTMPSRALLSNLDFYLMNLRSSYSHCQSRVLCALFSLIPPSLAALMRSACFFAVALLVAGMTLSRSAFHGFQIGFKLCKGVYCVDLGESFQTSFFSKIGFDTSENEPCKVCPLSVHRSPRCVCELKRGNETIGVVREK